MQLFMNNIYQDSTKLTYHIHFIFTDFAFIWPLILGILFIGLSILRIQFKKGANLFQHVEDQFVFQRVIGIFLVLVGILVFLFVPGTSTLVVDKARGTLTIDTGSRLRQNVRVFKINEISSITISRGGKTRSGYQYFMFANLVSGNSVQLAENTEYEPYSVFWAEANRVASYIGVQVR